MVDGSARKGDGIRDEGWSTRDTTNEGYTPHTHQATRCAWIYDLIEAEANQVKIWQGAGLVW